jgi:hypothetical protein
MTEMQAKANEAFYKWEADNNEQNLSDRDRMIWTAGWINTQATITLMAWALSNLLETADSYIEEGSYIEQLDLEINYSRGLLQDLKLTEFLEDEEPNKC